jgi:hypothetical protein
MYSELGDAKKRERRIRRIRISVQMRAAAKWKEDEISLNERNSRPADIYTQTHAQTHETFARFSGGGGGEEEVRESETRFRRVTASAAQKTD